MIEDEFAKYWRVYTVINSGGGYTAITEVEMYDSNDGENLCVPGAGTPTAKDTHWNHEMTDAFDGVKNSNAGWLTFDVENTWIQWEFTEPKRIVRFELTVSTTLDRAPKTFRLEYSKDGVNWTKTDEHTVTDWVGKTPRKFYTGLKMVTHRITGRTLTEDGLPVSRLIYAHDGNTYAISGTGYSDLDGYFEIDLYYSDSVMIRVVDESGIYNSVIRENVIPTEIPAV